MELFCLFAVQDYEYDQLLGVYPDFDAARVAGEVYRAAHEDEYVEVRPYVLGAPAEWRFESGVAV